MSTEIINPELQKLIDEYTPDGRFKRIPDEEVSDIVSWWQGLPYYAVDTETYYNRDYPERVTRFIGTRNSRNNTPFVITLTNNKEDRSIAIELNEKTIPSVRLLLEDSHAKKVFFNASYDLQMLHNIGIKVAGDIEDVMFIHHLLDEEDEVIIPYKEGEERKRDQSGKIIPKTKRIQGLKPITVKYLDESGDKFESAVDEVRRLLSVEMECHKEDVSYLQVHQVAPEIMIDYACSDTLYTMQLYNLWRHKLGEQGLEGIYRIETECIRGIVDIELIGHKVDVPLLEKLKAKLLKQGQECVFNIYDLVEEPFNVNSDGELVEAFKVLGAEYHNVTEKGNWQTSEDVLKPYLEHEIEAVRKLAKYVLEFRDCSKMLNTYVENLLFFAQEGDRVHPSFWQTGTRTGRMSSSKPNFQNIPSKFDVIRECFIPEDEYILCYFDAAQQEYRLLAHYAREQRLMDMIHDGLDVHTSTAALVLDKPYDDITDRERSDYGKTMNFALVYGLGLAAIAKNFGHAIEEPKYKLANAVFRRLGLKPWSLPTKSTLLNSVHDPEEKEAIEYYFSDDCKEAILFARQKKKEYFATFPAIDQLLNTVKQVTSKRGWVKTWTGRKKRYKNPKRDSYKAPNALIQGGCGDILKVKVAEVRDLLKGKKSRMVNLVHDEIQIEMHHTELDLIPKILATLRDLPFRVPIDWDCEYALDSWRFKKDFTSVEDLQKEYEERLHEKANV